jgi:hypothetical protein
VNRASSKEDLLQRAKEALERESGIEIVVEEKDVQYSVRETHYQFDAKVHLRKNNLNIPFYVELKKLLTTQTMGAIVKTITRTGEKTLLITEYVNPKIAERLKEIGIPFIDTAGNVYINEPQVFIYITGRKLETILEKPPRSRAFYQTGLKVLFALICKPSLLDATYRDIANSAGVALGTVGWVFTDLRNKGFLIEIKRRKRKFRKKEKLIDRWVEAYPELLRPKLLIGRYHSPSDGWWKKINNIAYLGNYLGGEVAAEQLTKYLKPEIVTIYVKGGLGKFLAVNRLKKGPNGNVEILKAFWGKDDAFTHGHIVHPLLVYADLLATGDPRNIETARIVYDKWILKSI